MDPRRKELRADEWLVIGVAGGSCSGKTLASNKLKEHYGEENVLVFSGDHYYKNISGTKEEKDNTNWDHPDIIDWDRFIRDLTQLKSAKANEAIDMPQYCFVTHSRKSETVKVSPKKIIVVEGILVLHPDKLRELFEMRVFIDTHEDILKKRRITRDTDPNGERKRDLAQALHQYETTVYPMYQEFILPSRKHAEVFIENNSEDRIINFEPLLKAIDAILKPVQQISLATSAATMFGSSGNNRVAVASESSQQTNTPHIIF